MPQPCGLSLAAVLLATAFAGDGSCPAGAGSRCRADSGTASSSSPAKAQVLPKADLITQEIAELKDFVRICKERIELLEDLNRTVKSGVDLSLPESHMRMLQEQLPMLAEVSTIDEDKAPTSSADDYLMSKAIIPQQHAVSFIEFMSLRSPHPSSSSTSSAQLSMPTTLLVAVQLDGSVRLYAPTGEQVLDFETGHDHPVTNVAVALAREDQLLATADAGGVIRVHRVDVRQRPSPKEQKQRHGSTDEKISQFLALQVNATVSFEMQMQVPAGTSREPSRLTALAMATQKGLRYFVAGDERGKVSIFAHNGTFVAQVDAGVTPGARVEAFYTHLSNLMFLAGHEWGFINLARLEVRHVECPEFGGRVISAVLDTQIASRVVISDEQGAIWVLNLNKGDRICKVEHRFPSGIATAPIELASIRGFTLALQHAGRDSGAASVLAFNMSHVDARDSSFAAAPSAIVWRTERQSVRDWAVQKRQHTGDLVAFLSENGREIEVLELLMQVYQQPEEIDWFAKFKTPIIVVGIVVVLGFQYMKLKGKVVGGGSGGFGDSEFDGADAAAFGKRQRRGN